MSNYEIKEIDLQTEKMISKELLSEIFDVNVVKTEIVSISHKGIKQDNQFIKTYIEDYFKIFNIDELQNKCKNWAISKGYQFQVFYQCDGSESWYIGKCGMGWDLHISKSAIEACQYLFDSRLTE